MLLLLLRLQTLQPCTDTSQACLCQLCRNASSRLLRNLGVVVLLVASKRNKAYASTQRLPCICCLLACASSNHELGALST
jgi:hypothetical protein